MCNYREIIFKKKIKANKSKEKEIGYTTQRITSSEFTDWGHDPCLWPTAVDKFFGSGVLIFTTQCS